MRLVTSFKGIQAIRSFQILAMCLLFSQLGQAAQSCRVQIGAGRVFAGDHLEAKVLILNLNSSFLLS